MLISQFLIDGVGVARVCVEKHTGLLHVNRMNGTILGNPGGSDMIFGPDEPRIGAFSTLLEGSYIYLWGTYKNSVVLARVPINQPHVRNEYQYWNGVEYVESISNAEPLMYGMLHGTVLKSSLFGKDRPWVVIGSTCWKDSKIIVGAATSLEGPWELTAVAEATGIECWHVFRYCVYPHTWLCDETKGELAISWSERWPGNIIMAKLKFVMSRSTQ